MYSCPAISWFVAPSAARREIFVSRWRPPAAAACFTSQAVSGIGIEQRVRLNEPILLTGATGYVGGRLLPALERRGASVRCLSRRPEALVHRVAGTQPSWPATCWIHRRSRRLWPESAPPITSFTR